MVILFPRCKACWVSAQTTEMRCRATELSLPHQQPWNDSTGQLVWLPSAKQLWLPADICDCLASFRLPICYCRSTPSCWGGCVAVVVVVVVFFSPTWLVMVFFDALWTVPLNLVAEPPGNSTAALSRTCFGLPRGYVLSSTPGSLWFCHLVVCQTIVSRTQDLKVFLKNQSKSNLSEINRKKLLTAATRC